MTYQAGVALLAVLQAQLHTHTVTDAIRHTARATVRHTHAHSETQSDTHRDTLRDSHTHPDTPRNPETHPDKLKLRDRDRFTRTCMACSCSTASFLLVPPDPHLSTKRPKQNDLNLVPHRCCEYSVTYRRTPRRMHSIITPRPSRNHSTRRNQRLNTSSWYKSHRKGAVLHLIRAAAPPLCERNLMGPLLSHPLPRLVAPYPASVPHVAGTPIP